MKEVTIQTGGGSFVVPVWRKRGPLAIHKTHRGLTNYTLTHCDSGLAVTHGDRAHALLRIADLLILECGEVTLGEVQRDVGCRAEVGKALKEIEYQERKRERRPSR